MKKKYLKVVSNVIHVYYFDVRVMHGNSLPMTNVSKPTSYSYKPMPSAVTATPGHACIFAHFK